MGLRALALGFMAACTHALAAAAPPVFEQSVLDGCKEESEVADVIMFMRQEGAPMSELMDLVPKSHPVQARTQHFVVSAYEVPRFTPYEQRKIVIDEFANQMYSECLSRHAEGQAYSQ